jgi:hypothetical protein
LAKFEDSPTEANNDKAQNGEADDVAAGEQPHHRLVALVLVAGMGLVVGQKKPKPKFQNFDQAKKIKNQKTKFWYLKSPKIKNQKSKIKNFPK